MKVNFLTGLKVTVDHVLMIIISILKYARTLKLNLIRWNSCRGTDHAVVFLQINLCHDLKREQEKKETLFYPVVSNRRTLEWKLHVPEMLWLGWDMLVLEIEVYLLKINLFWFQVAAQHSINVMRSQLSLINFTWIFCFLSNLFLLWLF